MIEIEFPDGDAIFFPADRILRQSFMRSGKKLQRDARAKQTAPKHGRMYKIGGRTHIAAADGEAPAVINGNLLRSTRYQMQGKDMLFGAGTRRKTRYAKFLERGTRKMGAKPFIFTTLEENYKNIESDITKTTGDLL